MMDSGKQKRDSIQSVLRSIEAQNGVACNREQLHRQMDDVKQDIETVGDPVLKTEYRRRLAVLRGGGN